MNIIKISILILVSSLFVACNTKEEQTVEAKEQRYNRENPLEHHEIALEVLEASKAWIKAFNQGDAKTCVEGYAEDAVMSAMPFGIKYNQGEIDSFWTPFIASGATNLVYTNVSIEVANSETVFLSASWSMNVGEGKIYQEKWVKQNNNWVLAYDDFEVLKQYEMPQVNETNPIGSHLELEGVIKASMEWTKGFNQHDATVCEAGYTSNATMNAVPFAALNDKASIGEFWTGLIKQGAANLIYHNPVFTSTGKGRAILSSLWSMNIGDGKIYQEKWVKEGEEWLLSYDEFAVLAQY